MTDENEPTWTSDPVSNKKTAAIYSLRRAAEAKAFAEVRAHASPTAEARDALLDAQLELEAKTQDAVEACHECGHVHSSKHAHYTNNVLRFDSAETSEQN